MSKQNIVLKGSKNRISVSLNKDIKFEELKKELEEKIKEDRKFLGKAQIALEFKDRKLSQKEEKELLDIINNNSDLNVVYILDDDEKKDIETTALINKVIYNNELTNLEIYNGSLRSGQELIKDTGVLILGDVNNGAVVKAKGNIIILGTLSGTVHAGADGNEDCFIIALKMNPVQLRIGSAIASSEEDNHSSQIKPEIAYQDDGVVYLDELSRESLSELKI